MFVKSLVLKGLQRLSNYTFLNNWRFNRMFSRTSEKISLVANFYLKVNPCLYRNMNDLEEGRTPWPFSVVTSRTGVERQPNSLILDPIDQKFRTLRSNPSPTALHEFFFLQRRICQFLRRLKEISKKLNCWIDG